MKQQTYHVRLTLAVTIQVEPPPDGADNSVAYAETQAHALARERVDGADTRRPGVRLIAHNIQTVDITRGD